MPFVPVLCGWASAIWPGLTRGREMRDRKDGRGAAGQGQQSRAYFVQVSLEYFGGSRRMPGVMKVEQLNTRPLAVVALKVSSAPPRKSSLPLVTGP